MIKQLIHVWKVYSPTSPNQKKNLKNVTPFRRYHDSCNDLMILEKNWYVYANISGTIEDNK
jgi:hypothetical protein